MLDVVDIHSVLIVKGNELLAYQSDKASVSVLNGKVQLQKIPLQDPSKPFDIGHIPDDMEDLVGQGEMSSILHIDIVDLMEC